MIRPTLESLGLTGRVAAITAGWQEREAEDDELYEHLGQRSLNLKLYERSQRVFAEDHALSSALHARQTELREMQDTYRIRLNHAVNAFRDLTARDKPESEAFARAIEASMHAVRRLDTEHLARIRETHENFLAQVRHLRRRAVAKERREIAKLLSEADVLAVAGGHVVVLLNRLRLFGIAELWTDRAVVAWSAGAMVLGTRIVAFHDSPPQGPGYAEVIELGLGIYDGIIPFPHAKRRLRLDDPYRVSLLGRRFAPHACLALDEGCRVDRDPRGGWKALGGTRRLGADGSLRTEGNA